jgi:hypothetical protein
VSERSTPPPRGPHAKESARDYLRPSPPLDLLSKQTTLPFCLAASRRNPRFPLPPLAAVDAASSSRSTPRDAQGGEEPAGIACRHPRAPRRPRNLAGVRVPRRPAAPLRLRRDRHPRLLRLLARFTEVPPALQSVVENPRLGSRRRPRRRIPPPLPLAAIHGR